MALGKRLINTGAAAAACSTDSVQAFGADAAFSSNIALYQLDGNANDTTTNYDATSDTGVTYSATGAKFGQAASFNGSSKIDLPSTVVDSIKSNSSFAVSAWFNTSVTGTRKVMFSSFDGTYIILEVTTGNQLHGIVANSVGTNIVLTIPITVTDGAWHHALFTGENGDLRLYLDNGTPQTSASWNGTFFNGTTGTSIGSRWGNNYFNGKIDQVRIFDKAISAEDVATLYAETTSTASNTNPLSEGAGVALYTMDYDASEASGYYDGTPSNVEFGVGGKINYGARFNGNNSYINTGATLLGQTYTVSLWFNANTITSSSDGDTLYAQYDSADVGRHIVSIYNGNLRIFVGGQTVQTISTTWSTSTWTHLVVTKDSSGYEAFVNGSSIGTSSLTANIDVTENTMIGGDDGLATYSFDGDIDQVRIFSKALSSDEVDTLYAETACVYECTTDDVNYPFSDGTNVEAYYKLDNSAEDETGSYDGTESNIEYTFGRFGQAAVFNGSSSKILPSSSPIPSSGAFTVSAWVKTSVSNHCFISFGDFWLKAEYLSGVFSLGDLNTSFQGTTDISDGNWHHCVLTVDNSNNIALYVDGTSEDTGTSTISRTNGGSFVIGVARNSSPVYYFNGSIDQVRIYSTALTSSQVTELYEEKPCADTSNFKAVVYEGNGGTQYISNVGMDLETNGGLVWIKSRTLAASHGLYDSVRGAGYWLRSDFTDTQQFQRSTGYLSSFDSNGFTLSEGSSTDPTYTGSYETHQINQDYAAWVWKGGGDAVNIGVNSITGSTPSIASDVSANKEAGFSIVKYTGNSTAGATIGHELNSTPELVIVKLIGGISAKAWTVYAEPLGNTKYLYLDGTLAAGTYNFWNNTSPTSDVFTVSSDTNVNSSSGNYIAYCFHSVTGYSKIGSYSGGSSGSSNVIVTGFKPSFLMVKRTDQAGDAWQLFDIVRGGSDTFDNYLQADNSNTEASYSAREVNFTTNGFYWTNAESGTNISSGTYIYMAFK